MDIVKLLLIFASILVLLRYKKPLYISISVGIITVIILFRINPLTSVNLILTGAFKEETIYLVLALYAIMIIQRMMVKRGHNLLAEEALSNLFHSKRVNAMVAPFLIGLMPSAGAVTIAAPIVDKASGTYLTNEEKTFVTSFYRHISELFLPTYASILLAISLTNIDLTAFVISMIPMVILLFFLGYVFYVRKIPKNDQVFKSQSKLHEIRNLINSFWPIALSIVLILTIRMPVFIVLMPVILGSIVINRFNLIELKSMLKSAFEIKLILATIVIMVLNEVLTFTKLIERLPLYFLTLPVPAVVIFALISFFGSLVVGSTAIVALVIPLAYAAIPNGGVGLMILLMSILYASSQISPTHVCLTMAAEFYQTSFFNLIMKTIPILVIFLCIVFAYSYCIYLLF